MNLRFSPFAFLISRVIVQNRLSSAIGQNLISANEPNRLGFVGGVLKPPAMGIVVASVIAQNEASSLQGTTVTLSGPILNAAAIGPEEVILIWSAVPNADSYTVSRTGGSPGSTSFSAIKTTGFEDDQDVDPKTTYSYSVQAMLGNNPLGPASNPVTVTTPSN
jgi:hypothetical protein